MVDREKVIYGLHCCSHTDEANCICCPYDIRNPDCMDLMAMDVLDLLKEQDELLRKLQKDKDKLCLEVSKWKHKFHDAPPKFVSQGAVDQIRWERDTALSQLEEIGKGLGSKMDDVVALLKEQEAVEPRRDANYVKMFRCGVCGKYVGFIDSYCSNCGRKVKWNDRQRES